MLKEEHRNNQGHEIIDLAQYQQWSLNPPSFSILKELLKRQDFFRPSFSLCQHEQGMRQHAFLIDKILDFRINKVELRLQNRSKMLFPVGNYFTWGPNLFHGVQAWVGIDPQTLNTPYCDLANILMKLKISSGETIIDLGAACGRMGVVLPAFAKDTTFIGIEYVQERVDEGQRIFDKFNLTHSKLVQGRIGSDVFNYPEGHVYFLYDYGNSEDILHTLTWLQNYAISHSIRVVVRGKLANDLINSNTLSYQWEKKGYLSISERYFKIYQL